MGLKMTDKEYLEKMEQAEKDYTRARNKINNEYVREMYPYKVGDTVTDHANTIEVITGKPYFTHHSIFPIVLLKGYCLTKKGERFKSNAITTVFSSNIIKWLPK